MGAQSYLDTRDRLERAEKKATLVLTDAKKIQQAKKRTPVSSSSASQMLANCSDRAWSAVARGLRACVATLQRALPGCAALKQLVDSPKFVVAMVAIIFGNTFVLAIEFHGTQATDAYVDALNYVNLAFTSLFMVEMVLRVCAYGCVRMALAQGTTVRRYLRPPLAASRDSRHRRPPPPSPVPPTRCPLGPRSPVGYCSDAMNLFDAFIVVVSTVESAATFATGPNSDTSDLNLSALRTLRLFRAFRAFKLARSFEGLRCESLARASPRPWRAVPIVLASVPPPPPKGADGVSMVCRRGGFGCGVRHAHRTLLRTVIYSITEARDLSLLLLIITFIFALLGMELFAGRFGDCGMPTNVTGVLANASLVAVATHHRDCLAGGGVWAAEPDTYDDLGSSFVSTVIVFVGENWNALWQRAFADSGWLATAYFVCAVRASAPFCWRPCVADAHAHVLLAPVCRYVCLLLLVAVVARGHVSGLALAGCTLHTLAALAARRASNSAWRAGTDAALVVSPMVVSCLPSARCS